MTFCQLKEINMLAPTTDRALELSVFTHEVSDEALEAAGWWDDFFAARKTRWYAC
jgi:hypothetical protein